MYVCVAPALTASEQSPITARSSIRSSSVAYSTACAPSGRSASCSASHVGELADATAVLPNTVHDTSAPVDDAENTRDALPFTKCVGGSAAVPVTVFPVPRG